MTRNHKQRGLLIPAVILIAALAGCASSAPPERIPATAQSEALRGIQVTQLPQGSGTAAPQFEALRPDPDPSANSRYASEGYQARRGWPESRRDPQPAERYELADEPGFYDQYNQSNTARRSFSGNGRTGSVNPYPEYSTGRAAPTRANQTYATSAAPRGITLGEGDVILFNMFGQEDMETTAFVSAQGTVSLPLIGETQVGGKTPGEAEIVIADAYRRGGYFKNPQVNITLEEFRSQQISVLGEVNTPGRYPLETRTTVLDALAVAEGITPTGSRIITVIRKGARGSDKIRVDIDDLVRNPDSGSSLALAPGDIVYVPEAELFYIYGEVRRPDAYAIKPGITLMQALSLGGGLTDKGSNSRIEIQRETPQGLRKIKPELTDRVHPDDVIYVKERFF